MTYMAYHVTAECVYVRTARHMVSPGSLGERGSRAVSCGEELCCLLARTGATHARPLFASCSTRRLDLIPMTDETERNPLPLDPAVAVAPHLRAALSVLQTLERELRVAAAPGSRTARRAA